jgi:translation elongation factor EF-Ts
MEQATILLRKKGLAAAGKKAGRITARRAVTAYASATAGVRRGQLQDRLRRRNENFRHFAEEVAPR